MESLILAGKKILLFSAQNKNAPLIILHTVHGEGESVYESVRSMTETDFSMAAVDGLAWDDEMSPWSVPPISKNDTPCTGGADRYLKSLLHEILPGILEHLNGSHQYIAIAGYSLAGLFALYSIYQTDIFSRVASASGSFWYPGFLSYIKDNKPKKLPDYFYLSLGDKEAMSKNKILQSVEENTRQINEWYESLCVKTIFEMNKGNHFHQTNWRMARGISWILQDI